MKAHQYLIAGVVIAVLMAATPVFADDLNPPPWRGAPNSTYQQWLFSNGDSPTPPDIVMNPYGLPLASPYPGTGQAWQDVWGGRQGVWPLSGTIEIDIPNRDEPNLYKDIWVQVTWAKQVSGSTITVSELDSGIFGDLIGQDVLGPTGELPPSDLWYHSTFLIHLPYNPAFETVKISGTIMVDQVVIDTICAPEPVSLSMLALGGVALLRRRR